MSDRTAQLDERDARPVVRTGDHGNRSLWLIGGMLLLAGLILFQALNTRRERFAVPQTRPVHPGGGMIAAPPPLSLAPIFAKPSEAAYPEFGAGRSGSTNQVVERRPALSQEVARTIGQRLPVAPSVPSASPSSSFVPRPATVFGDAASVTTPDAAAPQSNERVQAGRLLNPALTVPKGTVIAAVLETALDSSRAGAARAIVSRAVMGFDGTRILIPRGSRLYGEYTADVTAGQKRALIRWQRLTRPDGVIVNLDSPSADPLGRAGIEGKVDGHFFARFGSAILQSVLDIGAGLATRSVSDDAVILALPGSTQQIAGQAQKPSQVQPTLRVRQGTGVSVFVARDLDFSTVDH